MPHEIGKQRRGSKSIEIELEEKGRAKSMEIELEEREREST
jgi:hypothetical protein